MICLRWICVGGVCNILCGCVAISVIVFSCCIACRRICGIRSRVGSHVMSRVASAIGSVSIVGVKINGASGVADC